MKELKNKQKTLEKERTSNILKLGELKYGEMRNLSIDLDEIDEIGKRLVSIDSELFLVKKQIVNLELERSGLKCDDCGESISPTDKFCNNCGASLDFSEDKEVIGNCNVCNNELTDLDLFCSSCGIKI